MKCDKCKSTDLKKHKEKTHTTLWMCPNCNRIKAYIKGKENY